MRNSPWAAILLLASIGTSGPLGADSVPCWPCWLGPHRNGAVDYFKPPEPWPNRLRVTWKRKVGAAYSTPLLVGQRIYQLSRRGRNEVLSCLSVQDGRVLWQRQFEVPFKVGSGGERHGDWPKSTPCYVQGRIVTVAINGTIRCWDADTGRLIWTKDYTAEFDPPHPYWGAATSPVASDDTVFVHVGNDERGGALVALGLANGAERWRLEGDGPCYSSPVLATLDGVRQVIEWNHRRLVGVDATTGKPLWQLLLPHTGADQNMPSPVVAGDRIVLGAENRGIRCLRPRRNGNQWVVETLWHQKRLACEMSTPIVHAGRVFGLSHYDRGRLFCLDLATGKILWVGPPRTAEYATFLAVPGYVLALLSTGQLLVIDVSSDRYMPVAQYTVSTTPTWSGPVLLPGGILIKDHDTMVRYAFETGPR